MVNQQVNIHLGYHLLESLCKMYFSQISVVSVFQNLIIPCLSLSKSVVNQQVNIHLGYHLLQVPLESLCEMYFSHISVVSVFQNVIIPCLNCVVCIVSSREEDMQKFFSIKWIILFIV